MEGDNIIGLKQGKQSISLEPGDQFELSGAPVETLHQLCAHVNSQLYQVKAIAEEMGIGLLEIGSQPKWRIQDIPMMPKVLFDSLTNQIEGHHFKTQRFCIRISDNQLSAYICSGKILIVRNYMPKVGSLGEEMMFRTCTVQVNLDFSSEADMKRKFRASLALQPIATALFANSPFTDGKPNGFLSMRSQIWTDTDNNRTGMLPFVFDDSFGFERYVDHALDVPINCLSEKEVYDCTGITFWVKLKRYLEMRGADEGPWEKLMCFACILGNKVGLLYDEVSLQNVLDMIADWTPEEIQMLRDEVPRTVLKTPFREGLLKHVSEDVVKFAKDGLERRGSNESGFLN